MTCTDLKYKPYFLYLDIVYSKPFWDADLAYNASKISHDVVLDLVYKHIEKKAPIQVGATMQVGAMQKFLQSMNSSCLGELLIRLDGPKVQKAGKEGIANVQKVLDLWFPHQMVSTASE